MRLDQLTGSIAKHIIEEFKRLSMGWKDFPFYFHWKGHTDSHRDKFNLYWTTKEEYFDTPHQRDVVSELHCEVLGLHENQVLLRVKALQRKKSYLGQLPTRVWGGENDYYKQDWREEYFIVEASASALWTIMEAHADFERPVAEVMST